MKKLIASLSIAALVLSVSSCSKLKELVPPFDITLPDVPLYVQPVTTLNTETTLATGTSNFNIDAEIQKYIPNGSISNVTSVKVKSITLTSTNATNTNNLGNFSSARVLFTTNTNTSSAEIAASSIEDAVVSQKVITPADSPELKSYLNGSTYTFTVKGVARRQTAAQTLTMSVVVTVKP